MATTNAFYGFSFFQNRPLVEVLELFQERYNVYFSYNPIALAEVQVDFEFDDSEAVQQAIERLLITTPFKYESFHQEFYVIYEKSKAGTKDVKKLRKHWKEIKKLEQKGRLSLHKKNNKNPVGSVLQNYSKLEQGQWSYGCLLYTSPSPRDKRQSRMPSSA